MVVRWQLMALILMCTASSLAAAPREATTRTVSARIYDYARFDPESPGARRRSIYRFVVRSAPDPFMDRLDCPDPSVATPQRSASNTPVQALTLLNNAFVVRQAEFLAERLNGEPGEPRDQVRLAYRLLYGRDPVADEIDQAMRFLAKESLAAYARVLLNSNEFVYVP